MPRRITAVALVVPDYDAALDFYVGALGFTLVEDTPQGDGKRWVVVRPETGTALLLARAVTPEQESRIGDQTGGRVFLFLETDDFARDHAAYAAQGVTFLEEPRHEPYGTVAVFADPFGNKWDLIEPAKPAAAREIPVARPNDAHRLAVRRLLRAARSATLATTTADGAPYASLVTVATDHDGTPLLLLSSLADHTRNLAADPRCSLLAEEAKGLGNPQTGPRVSIQAIAEKLPPGPERDRGLARFLAHHPAAEMYAGFGDFALWRLVPTAAHWVGGFARAVWLGPEFLLPAEAASVIVAAEAAAMAEIDSNAAAHGLGLEGEGWRVRTLDADGIVIGRDEDETTYRIVFDPPRSVS